MEAVRRELPAAVVLDIRLPGLDGWDVLATLKADPSTVAVPVVIVSMLDERGKGFALGADEYLVKPVSREDVLSALGRVRALPDRGTLLAIDDDPQAIELVKAVLQPAGWTVVSAADGATGIAIARSQKPTAILLDLLMPGIDGFAVVEALRSDPETSAIPIVVLTAKAMSPAEKERAAGPDLVRGAEGRLQSRAPRGPRTPGHREPPHVPRGPAMTKSRILVVEDNERNLKLVRDVLQYAGYEVISARSGEQGVALAKEQAPDLVLMDLQLPTMDGVEALRMLRDDPLTQRDSRRSGHRLRHEGGPRTSAPRRFRQLPREADQCAHLPRAGSRFPAQK